MKRTKYISINKLKSRLEKIVKEVLNNDIEYIVMVDQEPRFKISSINDNDRKEVLVKLKQEEDQLEKFIKD